MPPPERPASDAAWEPELRATLQALLRDHGIGECQKCGRTLDENDVSFGTGQTEAGTEFYDVEIECSKCGHAVRSSDGWCGPFSAREWVEEGYAEEDFRR